MNKTSIIGVIGLAGAGKDTIGQYLIDQYNYQRDSFAQPLKDAVASIFCWPRELMEGSSTESRLWREQKDEFWSEIFEKDITPRWALQQLGTDILRVHLHQGLWIHSMKRRVTEKINNNQKICITDVRFKNEIDAIRDLGGIVINVKRGGDPVWMDDARLANNGDENARDRLNNQWKVHESEWAHVGIEMDYIVDNNSNAETLFEKIDKIVG